MKNLWLILFGCAFLGLIGCGPNPIDPDVTDPDPDTEEELSEFAAIEATFGGGIDMENLANYADQSVPNYITEDNTDGNGITDAGATLGRVLFYDKSLSSDNTVACASCHQQAYGFSDPLQASVGVAGTTGRHSMRLVNARFAEEVRFFWDERASTLEEQTTMPIQDHVEMGYSGADGDPSMTDLTEKLGNMGYYQELFTFVYGDAEVTEERMQLALAQFVRSIQSFDAKYDAGLASARNPNVDFANFTAEENAGKALYMAPPTLDGNGIRTGGGVGCGGCHRAPEFDIDPNTLNNGFIATLDGGEDETITRAPSLRDLFNADGVLNGGMMHTGELTTLEEVIAHYGSIDPAGNANLDPRLSNRGRGQQFNLTNAEISSIVAFLETLTGSDVYTNEKWSDPFPG